MGQLQGFSKTTSGLANQLYKRETAKREEGGPGTCGPGALWQPESRLWPAS